MRFHALAILALAAVAAVALAQSSTRSASVPASSQVVLPGLSIDAARRQVVIPAKVALRQGPLEFLLCREGTKDYESVLSTQTPPSSVHAALLAIGLSPGRPGHWVKADDAEPRFEPPAGALVDIAVRWKGPDAVVEIPAWKLLKPNRVGQEATAIRWVFVGSQMTDAGRYLADIEGTLISVANFPSAVLDVPFASTDQNALLEFSSNTDLLPAQGTEVEVVLTADKQAASAPQARLFISVDRLGRIELDGRIIASSALGQEARKFQAVHSQASAEVRIDAQALVYDRQRVQEALREGGLEEIDFRVAGQEPLPRTAEEAQTALEQWREQLSAGPDALNDPAEDASRFVKGLQRRQEELHTLGALWQQYAGQLQAMIRRAATSRNAAQATSAPGL